MYLCLASGSWVEEGIPSFGNTYQEFSNLEFRRIQNAGAWSSWEDTIPFTWEMRGKETHFLSHTCCWIGDQEEGGGHCSTVPRLLWFLRFSRLFLSEWIFLLLLCALRTSARNFNHFQLFCAEWAHRALRAAVLAQRVFLYQFFLTRLDLKHSNMVKYNNMASEKTDLQRSACPLLYKELLQSYGN